MNTLPEIGTVVFFAKRRGHVIGYFTGKRHGHAEEVQTWLIVQLDPESRGYLEKRVGEDEYDCFISAMLVHPSSINEGMEDV